VEEFPEGWIVGPGDNVETNQIAREDQLARKLGERREDAGHGGHEAAEGRAIEEARAILLGDGEGEGAEGFAMLHEIVEILADVRRPRRSEQAPIAKSAGTEFGAALTPGNDFAFLEETESGLDAESL